MLEFDQSRQLDDGASGAARARKRTNDPNWG